VLINYFQSLKFYLNLSSQGNNISVYHIESAIAAEHASTENFENTNWMRLLQMYDLLLQIKPSPMVELNRAVVLAEIGQIQTAIETISINTSDAEKKLITKKLKEVTKTIAKDQTGMTSFAFQEIKNQKQGCHPFSAMSLN
jgi:predicted RNA polymerase sigma factor